MSSVTSPCGERSLGHAIVRVQVLFRDNGTSVVQGGGRYKGEGNATYEKQKNRYYQARN